MSLNLKLPDPDEVDSFLRRVDEIEKAVKALADGTLDPSQLKEIDEKIEREELAAKRVEEKATGISQPQPQPSSNKPQRKKYVTDYKYWEKFQDVEDEEALEKRLPPESQAFMKMISDDAEKRAKQRKAREQEAEKHKKEGNDFYNSKKFEEAVTSYSAGLVLCPYMVPLLTNRAQAYLKLNRFDEAIADCNKAIKIDDKCVKAYLRRGHAQQSKKMFKEALEDLQQAYKLEEAAQKTAKRKATQDNNSALSQIQAAIDQCSKDMKEHEREQKVAENIGNTNKLFSELQAFHNSGNLSKVLETLKAFELLMVLAAEAENIVGLPNSQSGEELKELIDNSKNLWVYTRTKGILKYFTTLILHYLRQQQDLMKPPKLEKIERSQENIGEEAGEEDGTGFRAPDPADLEKQAKQIQEREEIIEVTLELLILCCLRNEYNIEALEAEGLFGSLNFVLVNEPECVSLKVQATILHLLQIGCSNAKVSNSIRNHLTVDDLLSFMSCCISGTTEGCRKKLKQDATSHSIIAISLYAIQMMSTIAKQAQWRADVRKKADEVIRLIYEIMGAPVLPETKRTKEEYDKLMALHQLNRKRSVYNKDVMAVHLKESACELLFHLSTDEVIRKSFVMAHKETTIKKLLATLKPELLYTKKTSNRFAYDVEVRSTFVVESILNILMNLCLEPTMCACLAAESKTTFPLILPLLCCDQHPIIRSRAAGIISRCAGIPEVTSQIIDSGVLQVYIDFARHSKEEKLQEYSMKVLAACSRKDYTSVMKYEDVLDVLIQYLSSPDDVVAGNAALCISEFAQNEKILETLREKGAVEKLIELLHKREQGDIKKNSAIALARLAKNEKCLKKIRELHGIELMHQHASKMKF